MKLIYYSLALPRSHPRPDLLQQLEASLRTLRTYNRRIPVILFAYGDVPRALATGVAPYGVTIERREPYEDRLARLAPRGAPVLARYPLLHKFLNFADIAALHPSQVLYLDCDTYFAGDVERVFATYGHAHVAAREEPTCARSPYGYDPAYLDEAALAALARAEGAQLVPPFNLGVVLFNHGVWESLARLDAILLSYAWRFAVWMALHPPHGTAAGYGEGEGIDYLREHFALTGEEDRRSALPYPSGNRWILDQVALWLTLGHVPGLTTCDFSPRDVIQDGEFERSGVYRSGWVLCHYYTNNLTRLDAWLRSRGDAP